MGIGHINARRFGRRMAVFDINLYVEVSHQGHVRRCRRHYRYVLEYALKGGGLYTKDGVGSLEDATAQGIALEAMLAAAGRIRKPSSIHLYTGCRELCGQGWVGRLHNWQGNGFLTAKGRPVRNASQWGRLGSLLEGHSVAVEGSEHPYKAWMLSELLKCK